MKLNLPKYVVIQLVISVIAVGILVALMLQIGPLIETRAQLEDEISKAESLRSKLQNELTSKRKELSAIMGKLKTATNELEGLTAQISDAEIVKSSAEIPAKLRGILPAEIQRIKESVHIVQESEKADAPKGREAENRNWYNVSYSVRMDRNEVTDKYGGLDMIGKVIYHFNKRWYTNPDRTRINRMDNFRLSVRVWGSTEVEVEIFLEGSEKSLSKRRRGMSLGATVEF